MKQHKERRDSVVPRGTFGSSIPPGSDAETGAGAGAAAGQSGEPGPGGSRKRYTSTLMGHPSVASPPPRPPEGVLAPPRWQGASAYREDAEPQPRVDAGSAASADPSPVDTAATEPRPVARIQPRPMFVHAASATPSSASGAGAEAELGEAIDELIESQSEVSDARDSVPELPLDEVLEAYDEPGAAAAPSGAPAAAPRSREREVAVARDQGFEQAQPDSVRQPAEGNDAPRSPRPLDEPEPPRAAAVTSLSPAERGSRPPRRDSSTRAGVLMVAAMTLIGGGFWIITRGTFPRSEPTQDVAAPPAAAAALDTGADSDTANDTEAAKPSAPNQQAAPQAPAQQAPAAQAAEPTEEVSPPTGAARGREPARRAKPSRKLERKPAGAAPTRAPAAEARTSPALSAQTNDDLLPTSSPRQESLPETPSRDAVLAALEPIRARVAQCARGQHGVAEVDLTVADTGTVTHAVVGGDFAGTPAGSCIARVVRDAVFRPFKKPRFRVIYPFSL